MFDSLVTHYARLFSRPGLSRINDALLRATLRARGYNNFRDSRESGEDFFICDILAPTNPTLCIDIGANVGGYTQKLLEHTRATVLSFEPLPAAFDQLSQLTRSHGTRSVVINKGVGKENGQLELHYNPQATAHASFSVEAKKVPYVSNENRTAVDVVTLDSYLEANNITKVDFIKIDTEGFESEVLMGATNTISTLRPGFIQIEFNWHQMFRNTSLNSFAEMLPGYTVYQLLPGGWVERDPRHPMSNIYEFSNFVFVRTRQ